MKEFSALTQREWPLAHVQQSNRAGIWHGSLALIVVGFLILGGLYSVVNPLFESPDEVWHYEYVRWLVEGNGLPTPEAVGSAPWHQEGSQPPLYYIIAAALTKSIPTTNATEVIRYNPHAAVGLAEAFGNKNMIVHSNADAWPWSGVALSAHLVRFFSLVLGVVTVGATFGTARLIFPGMLPLAPLAAALVAFNPQFLFLSASVNNDNLVICLSAAGIWLLTYMLSQRRTPSTVQLLCLGALVGTAAISKLSGLALAGLAGLTLLYLAYRKRSFRNLVRWGAIVGLAALLVGGWWYVRNWRLFGDPLALQAMFDILPRRVAPPTVAELIARTQGIWRSVWAVFGWFNVLADNWLYSFYTVLSLAGAIGLLIVWPVRMLLAAKKTSEDTQVRPAHTWAHLALLVIWIVVIFLALLQWAQMRYPQGRLLFPAISAFAILMSFGLNGWVSRRLQGALTVALVLVLVILAALVPWRWISPAYDPPMLVSKTVAVADTVNANFDDRIQLSRYELDSTQLRSGEVLSLALHWQALAPLTRDYSVFVHLTDDNGILQMQRDSHPGAGALPTSGWTPDRLIVDQHQLLIPTNIMTPARLRLDVGLYDFETQTRLALGDTDYLTLGYITLLPRESESNLPNSVFINFDDQIALIGYEFSNQVMQPGDVLEITLWWEALSEPMMDYVVFTHLTLPGDAVWAQHDGMPQGGGAPTSSWQAGQSIEDPHHLTLPDHMPAGVYVVEIGLYDPKTFDRLKVNFSNNEISLGQVKVVAP
ncbi:MAG: hypothetical protein GY759_12690 [Chloroflexi bacterium]|nr:hypothetical protein [Chloroflexota bacterium]